jgi:hypothetical protein
LSHLKNTIPCLYLCKVSHLEKEGIPFWAILQQRQPKSLSHSAQRWIRRRDGQSPFLPNNQKRSCSDSIQTLTYHRQLQILLDMTPSSLPSLSSETIQILAAHLLEFRDASKKGKRTIIASCIQDTLSANARPLEATRHRKVCAPFEQFFYMGYIFSRL